MAKVLAELEHKPGRWGVNTRGRCNLEGCDGKSLPAVKSIGGLVDHIMDQHGIIEMNVSLDEITS